MIQLAGAITVDITSAMSAVPIGTRIPAYTAVRKDMEAGTVSVRASRFES